MRTPYLVIAAMLLGCGGGGTPPTPPVDNTPATLAVSPSGAQTLQAGTTSTLTAAVAAKDGHALSNAGVTWSSGDVAIASVAGGVITAAKVGSTTITASLGALTATVPVTVTAGVATTLAVRTQPVGAEIGSALATQPVVEVRDVAGNVVTTSTVNVTVDIASGGGTLGGTTTVAAAGGVATFSGLSISGAAGARTLRFIAPGFVAVASASFTMALPQRPLIVLDQSAVSFAANIGTSPSPKIVTLTNGGAAQFVTVVLDPAVYDSGQPTGWLSVSLAGTAPPYQLTFTPSAGTLPVGSYHAAVNVVAGGASNSPATISITLTVSAPTVLTYGTSTERVRLLDPGTSFTPTVTSINVGVTEPATAVTFTSRATSVATVNASGTITAAGDGQAWIVASRNALLDSVFVQVTRAGNGPVLRADLSSYQVNSGDVVTVQFRLDPRGSAVLAGATVAVGYETVPGVVQSVTATIPTQTLTPRGGLVTTGTYRVNVSSATPITAPVIMLQIVFTARSPGNTAWFNFSILEAVDINGNDVSAQVTSTRYPVIVR